MLYSVEESPRHALTCSCTLHSFPSYAQWWASVCHRPALDTVLLRVGNEAALSREPKSPITVQ